MSYHSSNTKLLFDEYELSTLPLLRRVSLCGTSITALLPTIEALRTLPNLEDLAFRHHFNFGMWSVDSWGVGGSGPNLVQEELDVCERGDTIINSKEIKFKTTKQTK